MTNLNAWEREYKESRFFSGLKPLKSVAKFAKFIKKELNLSGKDLPFEGFRVLDLGSGTGRHSMFFAERGARVCALEWSKTAFEISRKFNSHENIKYHLQDFSKPLNFDSEYFDILLDVTSSNSLNNEERVRFLEELKRVSAKGAFIFVRALLLDGDKNAKNLLKAYPGKEKGYYVLPEIGIEEKVFSRSEFVDLYSKFFSIEKIYDETHYARFSSRLYKRKYLIAYLKR